MKVLVISDVHLKPWMFYRASELMKDIPAGHTVKPDRAVCLMDIADDWRQQFNLDLYVQTYDAAIAFAREYPDTLMNRRHLRKSLQDREGRSRLYNS